MLGNIAQWMGNVRDGLTKAALQPVLNTLADSLSSVAVASAGLVISADTFTARTGASTPFYALVQGRLVTLATSTAMPSLTTAFNVAQNQFNVVVFSINAAGTVGAALGTPATSLLGVIFPPEQLGTAIVGFVILNPTSAGFVGGSTALSGTAANAVYISPVGAIEPTTLIS